MISGGCQEEKERHTQTQGEKGREREKENMQKQAPGREGMEREIMEGWESSLRGLVCCDPW